MTKLEQYLTAAAEMRREIAELEPAVQKQHETKQMLEALKADILAELLATKSRGTDYVKGIRATKRTTPRFSITDEVKLMEWMESNLGNYQTYMRVNAPAMKMVAKEFENKTGKLPDGTEMESHESVVLEEYKEK